MSTDQNSGKIITITTDFGEHFATAQMEGVAYQMNPLAKIISVTDHITPFNILEGAFVLLQTTRFFPTDTVHVAVVDPGVGSSRKCIVTKTHQAYYVGPDNGIFYPAITAYGFEWCAAIPDDYYPDKSNTFHGRDVFIKLAAELTLGRNLQEAGKQLQLHDLVPLRIEKGQIIHLDGFGNIKINLEPFDLPYGTMMRIQHREKIFTAQYQRTLSDVGIGEWVVYVGSHRVIEVAMNQGNAKKVLRAQIGDIIKITPEDAVQQNSPTLFD
ncbi:MAG TPA: SAM-dependent chlorinase/fluorinase [bacterium]|nr:SAM-dependent chlorinase/fluorinase [bacterium]